MEEHKGDEEERLRVGGAEGRAERRLTPCKALFADKECSPHSDISLCHILSVSMVLVLPARLCGSPARP